jgi:hypothetical protein
MTRYFLTLGVGFLLSVSTARAEEPKPIKLLLTPAKPPTPALRYQLLPDARLTISGDAAFIYKQVIELLAKNPIAPNVVSSFSYLTEQPLNRLPREALRKELAPYDEVFALLDKAARCDHCDWRLRERLREKGIGTLFPEFQPMRIGALLLSVKARLELAEGRPDKALITLRSGFALARNIGDGDTLGNFLVGAAIAAIMEKQLDTFIAQPNAPNLYYALTDLPAPLFSLRKGFEGERVSIEFGTFPGLRDIVTNLDAGNLSEKDLTMCVKLLSGLSKGDEVLPEAVGRVWMGWNIGQRHELAKQALIEAGRPRDKVEAMPHIQVALLHAFLEYDAALDNLILYQDRPYWELGDHAAKVNRPYLEERGKNPPAAASPLVPLLLPAVKKVTFAKARNDRKLALLRTIEALRFYAATHDSKLPPSLAAIKEVPIPLDPVTGKSFEYQLVGEVAKLTAPPPAKEAPNAATMVVYELAIRK